eukprot:5082399-Alexandrium_andersonii.AAC.1
MAKPVRLAGDTLLSAQAAVQHHQQQQPHHNHHHPLSPSPSRSGAGCEPAPRAWQRKHATA